MSEAISGIDRAATDKSPGFRFAHPGYIIPPILRTRYDSRRVAKANRAHPLLSRVGTALRVLGPPYGTIEAALRASSFAAFLRSKSASEA